MDSESAERLHTGMEALEDYEGIMMRNKGKEKGRCRRGVVV